MGLAYKPHTALVEKVSAVMSGDRITRYERMEVGSVTGQMTEKTPSEISSDYGLETKNPALWLMDMGEAIVPSAGDRLTVNGRVYRVLTSGQTSDAVYAGSHLSVVCEQEDAWV